MGTNRWLVLVTMAMSGIAAVAQEKNAADKTSKEQPADPTKVEVFFAKEQVPDSVKVGAKVDLRRVDGQTIAGNGRVLIQSKVIVPGLEVVKVTKIDKPAATDEAVKVELKGTKEQIDKVNQYKDQKVRVVERKPGGVMESKEIRVPLRLEPAASEQKKSDDGKKANGKKVDDKKAGESVEKKGA